MYIPDQFKSENSDDYRQLIRSNPLALLISQQTGILELAELPLVLEQQDEASDYLSGHLARKNPVAESLHIGQKFSCVFRGPNAYISPTWLEPGAVPTWNYITLQLQLVVEDIIEAADLWLQLQDHALHYDQQLQPQWFDNFNAERRDRLLSAIVGVRFGILDIESRFKLSQNRSDDERQNIIKQLNARKDKQQAMLAEWMK